MNNLHIKRNKDSNVNNQFSDTFLDPLYNLNLNETSELNSFPMSNDNNNKASSRTFLEASVSSESRREQGIKNKKLESLSTPNRPVFSFNSVGGGSFSRKNFPSKWDDAEKWLMNTSKFKHCDNFKQQQVEKTRVIQERVSKTVPNFQAFSGISCSSDIVLKDKFTESVEPIFRNFGYSEPTKEGFLFTNQVDEAMKNAYTEVIHKDIGTEMSPFRSCKTSPFKSSSPIRHNTPTSSSGPLSLSSNYKNNTSCNTIDFIRLEECYFAKMKLGTTEYDYVTSHWSSTEEEEEEVSKSLRHNAESDCRTTTWEEEEKTKCCLRYQREEAKIQAWVDLQSAKAEAQSKKLEVKIQKLKSNLEEKLMKRMAMVHRKAEELRATAREQHFEQSQKAIEQAQKVIMNQNNTIVSGHNSCGCFPSNNNHH